VKAEGLTAEPVYYKESEKAIRANLKANGATEDEITFLLKERVELNAFASDQFIDWIERKLAAHGVKKVVPDDETLVDAYKRMRKQAIVQERIDELLNDHDDEELEVPDDLRAKIEECHAKRPALRWDAVVHHLAGEKDEPDDEEGSP
jgi:hypothetical protein